MRKKIIAASSWIIVLLWMILIFRLSGQVAHKSNGLSLGITDFIINAFKSFWPGEAFDTGNLNHIVRKTAHFTAYLILGILSCNALKQSGVNGWRKPVLALGLCILYAASDEVHQLFVAGRSGQPLDVFIDSLGAAAGIGIYTLLGKYSIVRNKKIKK